MKLTGILIFLLSLTNLFGQSVNLTPAADQTATFGASMRAGELPRPEFRDENNVPVARLRLSAENASAYVLNFNALFLRPGAQMFLYGLDAANNMVAMHGPYEGNGPLNVPEFASEPLPGATVVIEIKGVRSDNWPFELGEVEAVDAATLARTGLQPQRMHKPNVRVRKQNPDVRSAYVGGKLVKFEMVDGEAIAEGDVILNVTGTSKGDRNNSHVVVAPLGEPLWPSGSVGFTIDPSIAPDSTLRTRINNAISDWNAAFPGLLRARTTDTDYVTFRFKADECSSPIGRQGGQQYINLGNNCMRGNIVHEIGHALGLYHEHTRSDRNSFVTVNWGNIEWGKGHNFEIPDAEDHRDVNSYDYGSIMHYNTMAFSSNGNATLTITGTVPAGVTVGQRSALSNGDLMGIRSQYCSGMTTKGPALMEFDREAGGGSFVSTRPGYCTWTLSTNASWIKITSVNKSGTGSGNVSFTITENTGRYPRSGSIYYGGRSTVIRQEGTGYFPKVN